MRKSEHYLPLTENELASCKHKSTQYYGHPKHSRHIIWSEVPCEIAMYIGKNPETLNCTRRLINMKNSIVIALE